MSIYWLFEAQPENRQVYSGYFSGRCSKAMELLGYVEQDSSQLFHSTQFTLIWSDGYAPNTIHPELLNGAGEFQITNLTALAVMCYLNESMPQEKKGSPLTFSNGDGEQYALASYDDLQALVRNTLSQDQNDQLLGLCIKLGLTQPVEDLVGLQELASVIDDYF